MKIAVVGAGNVGSTLGKGWAGKGHEVTFAVRDPADPKHAKLIGPRMHVAGVPEAVAASEVVVLATPWPLTHTAIQSAGSLADKIVLDCTNPLKSDLSGLELGMDDSGGEQVARWCKGAHVFKAFNTTGADNMAPEVAAKFPLKPVMFICGDSGRHKPAVLELVGDLGFDARDAGDVTISRLLEPLALLWIHLTIKQGYGREWAFAAVRR
jgi:predicted dinucleotide-binding enzyme